MLAGQPKNAVETRRHARERKVGIARRAVLYGASILIGLYLLALLAARVRGQVPTQTEALAFALETLENG